MNLTVNNSNTHIQPSTHNCALPDRAPEQMTFTHYILVKESFVPCNNEHFSTWERHAKVVTIPL